MQEVALDGSLMQNDGIHPNTEGQQIILQLVWQPLQFVLYNSN
jgi:lysophospholipase L1-like esterase